MRRNAGWLFGAALLLPLSAAAERALITAKIDLAAEDGGQAAAAELAEALPDFPSTIHLDLQILPDEAGNLGVALSVPEAETPVPLDCSGDFGFIPGSFTELHLPLAEIYPHLLLTVMLDGLTEADGLVMTCDYAGGGPGIFHLQGAFVVSKAAIPTAHQVLLSARPID